MQDATALLSSVFGFSAFRPGQAEIVDAVAAGHGERLLGALLDPALEKAPQG